MIPNLRDVGMSINCIRGSDVMRESVLYRGGTINECFDASELPEVKSILNLRKGPDKDFSIPVYHVPAIDSVENYETAKGQVRNWAIEAAFSKSQLPLLVHCTAGKDRTGVIIALILLAIGINKDEIIEDYLFSEGVAGPKHILRAIEGFGEVEHYIYDRSLFKTMKQALLL